MNDVYPRNPDRPACPQAPFAEILAECQCAYSDLQARDFTSPQGLRLRICAQKFPPELRAEGLELYLVQQQAQTCLQEIGRLREQAFRRVGGGTHQEIDLDRWDRSGFWQLLCLDRHAEEICGAYRFLHGAELSPLSCEAACSHDATRARKRAQEFGSVHSLFEFSPLMLQRVLPRSVELGRSFVNEQARRSRLALPLLFEALGQIICQSADFILGKITFYPKTLDAPVLYLLYRFLEHYWGQSNNPLKIDGPARASPLLAWPRPGLDFRLAQQKILPPPGFSAEQLEALGNELIARLPQQTQEITETAGFRRAALGQLLQSIAEFYHNQAARENCSQQQAVQRAKQAQNALIRALALFLKYISLLSDDAKGMHVYGGAVNPHFGNVVEFMSLAEVQKFRRSHLLRWQAGS